MSRFAIRPIVASLAVTLAAGAFAGAASAAPDASPPAAESGAGHMGKGPGAHRFHHMQAMRDALWLPGVGPIGKNEVAKLKLDANQQALFDAARQSQQDLRKSMREGAMNRHKTLDAQLQAGKLDPHALADAQAQTRQQRQGQVDQVRLKWLALWDGLNDGQRQQVTQFVKERQARWEAHRKESHSGTGHRPAPAAPAAPSSSAS
jgi:protein CpxP